MLQLLLSALIFFGPFIAEAQEAALLQMETDRAVSDVHPKQDTLGVRVLIHKKDGIPVSGARLKVHLKAPETPWIGSTDFPVVEGTALLNQDLEVDGALHAFQFVPPIRGTYILTASVEPLPGDTSFAPTQSHWEISIAESPARIKNLAVLLAILVTVGGVSGFVLGRSPRAAVMLTLLFLLWPPASLKAHGSHGSPKPRMPPTENSTNGDNNSGRIDLEVLTAEPRVGEMSKLQARFHDADGKAQAARFHLEIVQLEHDHTIFATDVTAPDGILQWQGQFFDGSPHRISVTAVPLLHPGAPIKVERDVDVTGVEPPLRSVIKSFGFLMTITALALLSGILLGRSLTFSKGGLT